MMPKGEFHLKSCRKGKAFFVNVADRSTKGNPIPQRLPVVSEFRFDRHGGDLKIIRDVATTTHNLHYYSLKVSTNSGVEKELLLRETSHTKNSMDTG